MNTITSNNSPTSPNNGVPPNNEVPSIPIEYARNKSLPELYHHHYVVELRKTPSELREKIIAAQTKPSNDNDVKEWIRMIAKKAEDEFDSHHKKESKDKKI